MLALEVLVQELLLDRLEVRLPLKRHERHGAMHSTATAASRALAALDPQVKGACRLTRTPGMSAGSRLCIVCTVGAGLPFVIGGDLVCRHLAGDRHFAVEIVGPWVVPNIGIGRPA